MGKIKNNDKMSQLIDFEGLDLDGYIHPTDIDGIIEYKDSEYILFEIKYREAPVPLGQKLAIQRMVDDFTKLGKKAVAFVGEHTVRDTQTPVIAAWCKVREVYCGDNKEWRKPNKEITIKEAVDIFQKGEDLFTETINKEERQTI